MTQARVPERTYENAITIINGRRRPTRPDAFIPADPALVGLPDPSGTPDLKGLPSLIGMVEWLSMLGYSHEQINSLNVIHIAGTKGKGSTCAFTESFLRAHGKRTGFPSKTGMYTSPHLIVPEERIRIDCKPLDRAKFAKYFFEVYDKLPQLASAYDRTLKPVERGPRNLQLYALLAFHTFIREQVDVAIIETHHGGEYDATNFLEKPVVTAITSLGMDHVDQLGPTIENIAWHKAGIYKQGAVSLSTIQDKPAAEMLQRRASEVGNSVTFIDLDERLPKDALQLQVPVQRKNASLALAAAEAFLGRLAPPATWNVQPELIRCGIEQWSWPGRFQILRDGPRTWFLDAAHNEMSVNVAVQWFAQASRASSASASHVLIFAHISNNRDAIALLRTLAEALKASHVELRCLILTTYDEDGSGSGTTSIPVRHLESLREVWADVYPISDIFIKSNIHSALRCPVLAKSDQDTHILITGSQHLVGPALRILEDGNVLGHVVAPTAG